MSIFKKSLMALALSASFGAIAAAPAVAEIYGPDGVNGPEVAEVLQSVGYRAELTEDGVGDPLVLTTMSGVNVQIFFYNCTDEGRCEDLQFSAGFDLPDGVEQSVMDDWNRNKRFGRAHLDEENDPYLKVDLQVGPGGTPELIAGYVTTMEAVIAGFTEHIDF